MSKTKTPLQITKERFVRLGLVTVKSPFVYVLVVCLLAAYFAPGTTPIVVLGKDATTWMNWFLSLASLWWAVNFIIFMTRNDRYTKSDELVVVNRETVRDEVTGNRQDVWLYVGATLVILVVGLVQQFVAGGANIVILLFLLLLQLAPLAGGTSLQEQAMHEGKYISTFFLILLIAFVLVFGPRPFQAVASNDGPPKSPVAAQQAVVPKPSDVPKAATVSATSTPAATTPQSQLTSAAKPTVVANPPTAVPPKPVDSSNCPSTQGPPQYKQAYVEAGEGMAFSSYVTQPGDKYAGEDKVVTKGQITGTFCRLKDKKQDGKALWWKVK